VWLALLAALAAAAPGDRFVPPVERDGARAVVPLVFPDGTRARLSYPARLRLAQLGVEPYTSGALRGDSPYPGRSDLVARDFIIRHERVGDLTAGWKRLADYPGARGFWDSGPGPDDSNYLALQFGRWAVLVYDFAPESDDGQASMTDAERAAWAQSLRGRVTAAGFLRLRGSGPLRLARSGDHAGPQLTFGGAAGPLALTPGRCRRSSHHDRRIAGRWVNWSRHWANWCVSSSMRANAHGRRHFLRTLIRSLDVR
jgi:hypothetical protein